MTVDNKLQEEGQRLAIAEQLKTVLNYNLMNSEIEYPDYEVVSNKELYSTIIQVLSYFPDDAQKLMNIQRVLREDAQDLKGIRYVSPGSNDLLPYEGTRRQVVEAIGALLEFKRSDEAHLPFISKKRLGSAIYAKERGSINPGTNLNDAEMIRKAFEVIGITDEDMYNISDFLNNSK